MGIQIFLFVIDTFIFLITFAKDIASFSITKQIISFIKLKISEWSSTPNYKKGYNKNDIFVLQENALPKKISVYF